MESLLKDLPRDLDLTNPAHLAQVKTVADSILDATPDPDELLQVEADWASRREEVPLIAQAAIKLARSRATLRRAKGPFHLSVVFAVYREHTRILTRDQHPHGEDFLREKLRQLEWLFDGVEGATWDLTLVDDGCPEGSGRAAQAIIDAESLDAARVLFLEEAIQAGSEVTRPLTSPAESRKGGSVLLGMWEAARLARPRHVILFTDADLSTHLGQAGLLIAPLLNDEADAAIGSRREPTSIAIKQGTRNVRGKLFIYLWKRLFPLLREVVDTQCGFKAFTADTVRSICAQTLEKQFAFDVELLLKTELRAPGRIRKVPVAWIDSEAASTTTDLQPYLSMLKSMVEMARTYLQPAAEAQAFAELIDSLTEERWQRLVDNVPEAIAVREPYTFGEWSGVSASDLRALADD